MSSPASSPGDGFRIHGSRQLSGPRISASRVDGGRGGDRPSPNDLSDSELESSISSLDGSDRSNGALDRVYEEHERGAAERPGVNRIRWGSRIAGALIGAAAGVLVGGAFLGGLGIATGFGAMLGPLALVLLVAGIGAGVYFKCACEEAGMEDHEFWDNFFLGAIGGFAGGFVIGGGAGGLPGLICNGFAAAGFGLIGFQMYGSMRAPYYSDEEDFEAR